MSENKKTVLVVEDHKVNRKIVCKLLQEHYSIIEAVNGLEAINIIQTNRSIGVILLDLIMPVMDGFQVLAKLKEIGQSAIPVIVMTGSEYQQTEINALRAGAIDFVRKPVDRDILLSRIENAMIRNQMVMMQRMEFIASHDSLTSLYNRNKMFNMTRKMLDSHTDIKFALVRFDIDKFRMYNAAMGEAEGDTLLQAIGDVLRRTAAKFELCTYGRVDADVFCICEPFDSNIIKNHARIAQEKLSQYRPDYVLNASFGVYIIDDPSISVETMFTRASMASDCCKNRFDVHYAYYDLGMSEQVTIEQEITNEMRTALTEEQFEVYLQPKYNLNTDTPCGAEALVRWNHPQKGLIFPGKFIPVFEKNGFIATLDYYMWEHVCALLHEWIIEEQNVYPISVNMSRVSLFNRHVSDLIIGLTDKYNIPPELLQLEVTESAYMSNPELMGNTIAKLHKAGFKILMDDFGSGYSSLNTLKQITIDVLKLDMKFMPNGNDNGKSEKILSSVVRMAGWLGMEIIAEGVETIDQKNFLLSIGCGYVQGYYYAKPMPVHEYKQLMENCPPSKLPGEDKQFKSDSVVWSSDAHIAELLASIDEPVALFEYSLDRIELVRTNPAYAEQFGSKATLSTDLFLQFESRFEVKAAMEKAVEIDGSATCDVSYISEDGNCHWIRIKAKKISEIPKATIICCLFEEITEEKLFESRLEKVIGILDSQSQKKKILVIDDIDVSRAVLATMFSDKYEILEACNGLEGLKLLEEHTTDIAAILLDMIMPQMNGQEFLKAKNALPGAENIPVVVISSESDIAVQLGMLKNGVSDYIVKPFDFEVACQRVENAMAYQSRFKQLVAEYRNSTSDK